MPTLHELSVGDRIPERRERLGQGSLIRYAGASGDFNPLHWDPAAAAGISPTGGVIAHGMLNMGVLANTVTEWAGAPERVREMSVSFRAPCPVDAVVVYGGEVHEIDHEAGTVTLAIWAETEDGMRIINRRRSRAVVTLT